MHFMFQPLGGTKEYTVYRNTTESLKRCISSAVKCNTCPVFWLPLDSSFPAHCRYPYPGTVLRLCMAGLCHHSLDTQHRGRPCKHIGVSFCLWQTCARPKKPKGSKLF